MHISSLWIVCWGDRFTQWALCSMNSQTNCTFHSWNSFELKVSGLFISKSIIIINEKKTKTEIEKQSSIQLFFCGNCSGNDAATWCHFACNLKEGTWVTAGGFVGWKRRGKKKVSVLENEREHWSTSSNKNKWTRFNVKSVSCCLTSLRKKTIVYNLQRKKQRQR